MAALHPFRVADAAAASKLDPITLDAIVKGTLWVLATGDTLGNVIQTSGEIALAVAWAKTGDIYFYDSTDTTTSDDGATCLVDNSGHRYKLWDGATLKISSVLNRTNTPPGTPSVGDAYICGTAPTGAWSGFHDDVAIYTRRGWVFGVPEIGTALLNQATSLTEQFSAGGTWGPFASADADGSVRPRSLQWPLDGFPVESATNTPPGSPTVGLYYICGAAPTGAWSGKAGKVATYYNSAWEFLSPYEGAQVYNRALGYSLTYTSGVWGGQASSNVQTFLTAGSATWTKPSIGTMAHIECWGAGGSGGRIGSGAAGGGGGGAYTDLWIPLASLGATETVTVGAGGASVTSGNTSGAAGGNSQFGAWLTAYGGGGGATAGGGGGGAGQGSAGSSVTSTTGGNGGTNGAGYGATTGSVAGDPANGVNSTSGNEGGSGGGRGTTSGNDSVGGSSINGGAGGGGGNSSSTGSNGGKSYRGGGGGGGTNGGGAGDGSGGASVLGGNGGAASHSGNATAGSQPGGGGGAGSAVNSGKGGDGMVRVSVF